MNHQPHQIDAIVREVLRRLRALDPSLGPSSSLGADPEEVKPSDTLYWEARLVTWAELSPRLEGHARISFPARAIVTPLVKDELKHRGIAWSFREATHSPWRSAAHRTLLLWGDDEPAQRELGQLLTQQLTGSDLAVVCQFGHEPSDLEGPSHDVEILVQSLDVEARAVVLSRRPYRAACALNRHGSLRAVVVSHTRHVRQMSEETQANVLVFDIARQSSSEILHGVRSYLRHWSKSPGCVRRNS